MKNIALPEHGQQEKEKVSRISFSLRPQLQKDFDRVSKSMGYEERSKALQIAIQNLINDYELKSSPERLGYRDDSDHLRPRCS